MKQLINVRDLRSMLRKGTNIQSLPEGVFLTPAARDYLRTHKFSGRMSSPAPRRRTAPAAPKLVTSQSSPRELEAFFRSPGMHELKLQICDIGRRMWEREYVAGNGGNVAIKVGKDLALCTPSMLSKGYMCPEDMCLVDFEGRQLAGNRQRTSEILVHVQIMERQPRAVATVHSHPPLGTAFGAARVLPTTGVMSEYEAVASVAIAPYRTPGTRELANVVADFADAYNIILMANHGAVSWSHVDLEDAYFKMEVLEAHCHAVLTSLQLRKPLHRFSAAEIEELLKIKRALGFPDPRLKRKGA